MRLSSELKRDAESLSELLELVEKHTATLSDTKLHEAIIFAHKRAKSIRKNLQPAFEELSRMAMQLDELTSEEMTRERKHKEDQKRIKLYRIFAEAGCTPEMLYTATKAEGLSPGERIVILVVVMNWSSDDAKEFIEQLED